MMAIRAGQGPNPMLSSSRPSTPLHVARAAEPSRVRRLSVAAAAIVAAAIAASLLSATAASAAPRSFYGVFTGGTPSPAEFNRLGAGGAGTVRANFAWTEVQAGPNTGFNWARYDAVVYNAAVAGIEILPVLYGSPAWAAPTPEHPPSPAAFQALARAAAERYGHNGTFWTQFPSIPRIPITYWQIWNEANSESFWRPKPNAKQYVRLLRAARTGIKQADPQAKIVLAGFFPTPNTRDGILLRRYLPQIYRAKGRKLFDVAALHPYSPRPKAMLKPLRMVREIMARYGDKKTPLWLTEIGWASGGPPTPLTVTPERQAAYLRQTFKLADRNRKRFKTQRVYWYALRDTNDPIWYANSGLFTVDGAPKPSWGAFVSLTGGTP
jgi:hypothetical protein